MQVSTIQIHISRFGHTGVCTLLCDGPLHCREVEKRPRPYCACECMIVIQEPYTHTHTVASHILHLSLFSLGLLRMLLQLPLFGSSSFASSFSFFVTLDSILLYFACSVWLVAVLLLCQVCAAVIRALFHLC